MAHVHTQIRNAIATALTGLATTGARVFPNRLYAMDSASLPGLRVFMDADEVTTETVHSPSVQSHVLTVAVECCARAAADLDDALDQISLEVETAIGAGISVSGKSLQITFEGSQIDDEPGSPPVGVKRLVFRVSFFTASNAPDVLI